MGSSERTFPFPPILILTTIGVLVQGIYLPSLPSIRNAFSSSSTQVQLTLTLYLVSFSLSQIIYGPLSEGFGRRKIALVGIGGSLVGSTVCLLSQSIFQMILGRFLQGLGLGAGVTLSRTALRDVYSGNQLVFYGSFLTVGNSVALAAGPVIGGLLDAWTGWRFNFMFIILYTIVGFGILFLFLPETNQKIDRLAIHPRRAIQHYLHLLKNPIFLGYTGCSSFIYGGLMAYYAASPFLLQEIAGLTPQEYGWQNMLVVLGLTLGGLSNRWLVIHFGRHRTSVLGLAFSCTGGIVMAGIALFEVLTSFSILFPMFLYTIGMSLTFANAFAGAFQPFAQIAGFAGALFGCLQVLGGAVVSGLVAALHEKNQIPLSLILILVSLCAYLFQYFAFKASKAHFNSFRH